MVVLVLQHGAVCKLLIVILITERLNRYVILKNFRDFRAVITFDAS